MAYEVTNYGHNASMYGDLSPSMDVLLNYIESDEDFSPVGTHEEKLTRIAEEKGLIRVV